MIKLLFHGVCQVFRMYRPLQVTTKCFHQMTKSDYAAMQRHVCTRGTEHLATPLTTWNSRDDDKYEFMRRAAGSALEPESRPTLPGRRLVLDYRQICEECDNRPHYPNPSSHVPYMAAGWRGRSMLRNIRGLNLAEIKLTTVHVTVGKLLQQKFTFYIRGSVHRNSRMKKSNEMQQYADMYLLLNYFACFGRLSAPIIRST